MKRIHIMLTVADLGEAVDFYSTLFDAEPTKRKSEYAKWMLDDPLINFSIASGRKRTGIEHLGIEAESADELEELRTRIGRAEEAAIFDEGETTCCYANSDKTWVTDAQGVSWEMFYTHGDADSMAGDDSECCGVEDCCTSEAQVPAEACC